MVPGLYFVKQNTYRCCTSTPLPLRSKCCWRLYWLLQFK